MGNYKLIPSTKFKKDIKKQLKNNVNFELIKEILLLLEDNGNNSIPQKYTPHKLIGNYNGYWECHIKPDLLLIWEEYEDEKEIGLVRIGSHSELFK